MYLEDLIDENGLQQDEWSLTRPTFGEDNQLTVVGWSGKKFTNRLYVVRCKKCSQDTELFGDGYFKSKKCHLINMQSIPCGCSNSFSWSREQYAVRCSRKAEELGYKFLGFSDEWKGYITKIKMLCQKHGEWDSGTIDILNSKGSGCPKCKFETFGQTKLKPDEEMIESFFRSGAFHPDTRFWRGDKTTKDGARAYWYVSCAVCGETSQSYTGSLQKGCMPCICGKHKQQEGYINWVVDEYNTAIAIKFGIARNSEKRLTIQNLKSAYSVVQHCIYTFPTISSCKKAERDCLKELECGVVLKRDFPDGYTETTWVYNLEKIIEIYERNGGIEK